MSAQAPPASNSKPQEHAPSNDAAGSKSASNNETSNRLLEDSRQEKPKSDLSSSTESSDSQKDKNGDEQSGENKSDSKASAENNSAGDAHHHGGGEHADEAREAGSPSDASSTANDHLRNQVDSEFKTPEARSLFNNAKLSASVMAIFGSPQFVDEARSDLARGGRDADSGTRASEGSQPPVESLVDKPPGAIDSSSALIGDTPVPPADATPDTKDSSDGSISKMLSDTASWAASMFNDYVAQPISNGLSSVLDMYGSAGEWSFDSSGTAGSGATELPSPAAGQIAQLNDVSRQEFRQQTRDTMRSFDYDLKAREGLELPQNATADGVAEIGGEKVAVFRTPEGDAFLKKGDQVVAKQDKDGNYDLALSDGSTAKVRLSKDGDQYKIDHLERFKGDQLQQKIQDGVFYNYNYDASGNQTVDAAADFKGAMTPEQLEQRLATIRKELGPHGTAALRFGEGHDRQRLLMQTHGEDKYSLTDINEKRSRLFLKGQELRVNEHDQIGIVGTDGKITALNSGDPASDAEGNRLKELAERIRLRAQGDGITDVDGVKLEVKPDGDAVITRLDQQTGEPLSHTELPAKPEQPVKVTNDKSGEVANLDGDRVQLNDRDNNQIFGFNPDTGFNTNDWSLDDRGLTDLQNGMNLDPEGSLFDGDGEFISGSADSGEDFFFTEPNENLIEHRENMETAQQTSQEVNTLGTISLSISRSGNPNAVGIARSVAAEALGIASSTISELGNDMMAKIPVFSSQSIAETALQHASREDRTQTYAMRMGISDSTSLSQLNQLATFTTTSLSPEELVRQRILRVA